MRRKEYNGLLTIYMKKIKTIKKIKKIEQKEDLSKVKITKETVVKKPRKIKNKEYYVSPKEFEAKIVLDDGVTRKSQTMGKGGECRKKPFSPRGVEKHNHKIDH